MTATKVLVLALALLSMGCDDDTEVSEDLFGKPEGLIYSPLQEHERTPFLLEYTNGETKFVRMGWSRFEGVGPWLMVEVEKKGDRWVPVVPDDHPEKDYIRRNESTYGMLRDGGETGTEIIRDLAPELVMKKEDWNVNEGEFTEATYRRAKEHIAKSEALRKEMYDSRDSRP